LIKVLYHFNKCKRGIAMKKNLYLIISILIAIVLLATAALCNLGGTEENGETQAQSTESNNKDEEGGKDTSESTSSTSSGDSDKKESADKATEDKTSNTSSGDSDKKEESKPDDIIVVEENEPPVISGIYLDGLDPIDYYFFTEDTYTVRAEAIDPEGGSLSFSWSGDGTIAGNDINPMSWTAPASEGVYNLTVEVTDDEGATSNFTSDIYVNVKPVADQQKPNNPPSLGEILVCDEGTITPAQEPYYDHFNYSLYIQATDPDGDTLSYEWTVSGGRLGDPNINPTFWSPPLFDFDPDKEYAPATISVTVDDGKGEIITKSLDILLYIQ
jgi:hypothetical protein